jgi:hypothetical protein
MKDSTMGGKATTQRTIPLCHKCHIEELHKKGEIRFYDKLGGIGRVVKLGEDLFENSGDINMGNLLIIRFKNEH